MKKLEQWLAKLQNTNIVKLGLDNTLTAARCLDLKKPAKYIITVAGTNGKGSVVHLLEALFTKLGYKTGCYTSPHLISFNERIRINQQCVPDDAIVNSFEFVDARLKAEGVHLTFFEFITVSAWYLFQNSNLDVAVLEIGLGGRLDTVNTIPKDLAIITCVDYDHQHILGENLEDIGKEKAGIIEFDKPVILGNEFFPNSVLSVASEKSSNIYQYDKNFTIKQYSDTDVEYLSSTGRGIKLDLSENFNIKTKNIATAIKALEVFDREYQSCIDINLDKIKTIIYNFNLLGRCSWIDSEKSILMDVAHNVQSIENLSSYLNKFKKNTNKKIIAVCGFLADKDKDQCLKLLVDSIDCWNFVSINDKRGEKAENLAKILTGITKHSQILTYDSFDKCYNYVYDFLIGEEKKDSVIVIFGSFHVVGPMYQFITSIEDANYLWKFS